MGGGSFFGQATSSGIALKIARAKMVRRGEKDLMASIDLLERFGLLTAYCQAVVVPYRDSAPDDRTLFFP